MQEERAIAAFDQRGTRGRVALESAFLVVAKLVSRRSRLCKSVSVNVQSHSRKLKIR